MTFKADTNGNVIHSTAIIDKSVGLGFGNYVGPNCYITGRTSIGNDNRFEAYCAIGTRPEHKNVFKGNKFEGLVIGSNNVFREFVTINTGLTCDTFISDNCIFLRGAHVGHCSSIGPNVSVHCNCIIGGHCVLAEGAYLGLGAILNPRVIIPAYAVIGSNSTVLNKQLLKPFLKYAGSPVKEIGYNSLGIERAGLSMEKIYEINKRYGVVDSELSTKST